MTLLAKSAWTRGRAFGSLGVRPRAGASKEFGLPVGAELKRHVADLLDIGFDFNRQQGGDPLIADAFRLPAQHAGLRDINPYLHAAWRVRDAMPQATLIDNFLDIAAEEVVLETAR